MAARQRLFIALPCPLVPPLAQVLDELRAIQASGNSGLRLVDPDTLHITLKFLGAVGAQQTADVSAAMTIALRGAVAPTLELKGAGHFHGALWLGLGASPELAELVQRCNKAMEPLGFAPEQRPFRPHVTVARLKNNPAFDCEAWVRRHRDTRWGELMADTVHLYRSETFPPGARYTVLHTVSLR